MSSLHERWQSVGSIPGTDRDRTRPINLEGKERDRQIQQAIQGRQDGKYKTYAEAALILKVPQATLYAHAYR